MSLAPNAIIKAPSQSLVSLGRTELAGQRDENRRNPERIDDHDQRDKRLQDKLQKAFIHVG